MVKSNIYNFIVSLEEAISKEFEKIHTPLAVPGVIIELS
jgi:hypothetical protein